VTNNTKDQGAWGPAHASAIQLPARKLEHLMVPPTEVAKLPCFLEEATIMMELLKRHATSLFGQPRGSSCLVALMVLDVGRVTKPNKPGLSAVTPGQCAATDPQKEAPSPLAVPQLRTKPGPGARGSCRSHRPRPGGALGRPLLTCSGDAGRRLSKSLPFGKIGFVLS
jgi:hypothetical protein